MLSFRIVSCPHAQLVSNFLDMRRRWPCVIFGCMVMAITSYNEEKAAMSFCSNSILYSFVLFWVTNPLVNTNYLFNCTCFLPRLGITVENVVNHNSLSLGHRLVNALFVLPQFAGSFLNKLFTQCMLKLGSVAISVLYPGTRNLPSPHCSWTLLFPCKLCLLCM